MNSLHADRATPGHVRIVFGDRVVFLRFGADATLGDIARTLEEIEHCVMAILSR
jgi:hypothetical protein